MEYVGVSESYLNTGGVYVIPKSSNMTALPVPSYIRMLYLH